MLNNFIKKSKSLVFVGAGTSHLPVLKKFSMSPVKEAELFWINPSSKIYYSGMLSGWVSGLYKLNDIEIDLIQLSSQWGVRWIEDKVIEIDRNRKYVLFKSRPPIPYDFLSLNIGSSYELTNWMGDINENRLLRLRPFSDFILKIIEIDHLDNKNNLKLVVIGGGTSGIEMSLALRKRWGCKIALCEKSTDLGTELSISTRRKLHTLLSNRGVEVLLNSEVNRIEGNQIYLKHNKNKLEFDYVLLATNSIASGLAKSLDIKKDSKDYVLVKNNLQSISDPNIFATGDCATFQSFPNLPKNGVYAVRMAKTLERNLRASFVGSFLKDFIPQTKTMSIVHTSETAIINYGCFSFATKFSLKFKKYIDERWMALWGADKKILKHLIKNDPRCGGCGSKVSGEVLSNVIHKIVDSKLNDDAAVVKISDVKSELLSLDYFKSCVSDPYLFGRVTALHAMNDIYAMNGIPKNAMALASLPLASQHLQEFFLEHMLKGAVYEFNKAGVELVGGHTVESESLALGFSINGVGETAKLFLKSNLKLGDKLILTKPLGTGVLLAGLMRAQTSSDHYKSLFDNMLLGPQGIMKCLQAADVVACTDVTGFGFIGHLTEMLKASNLSAVIDLERVPVLEGARKLFDLGVVSSLQEDNKKLLRPYSSIDKFSQFPWLFDPQTSGGFLFGVKAELSDNVIQELKNEGYIHSAIVGEVILGQGEVLVDYK